MAPIPPDPSDFTRPDLRFGAGELAEARWLVKRAVEEDAPAGDLTTEGLFGERGLVGPVTVVAEFSPRRPGIICGLPVVVEVFRSEAPGVELLPRFRDGDRVKGGEDLLTLRGSARDVLRLERIALNFLQRLSGIATATGRLAAALTGFPARLLDTRKTTPGWRRLEKYAVRAGGGENHRSSLSDGILVKDNHLELLAAAGRDDMKAAVAALRRAHPGVFLQVEAASREEFLAALDAGVDSILLDNFALADLEWAVKTRGERGRGGPGLEASGGITGETIRAVAATGVDRISVGALTHSAPALDIGLDVVEGGREGNLDRRPESERKEPSR
jgi:nicotinate-nucleotide pyrophosphorylase (carboxylating)